MITLAQYKKMLTEFAQQGHVSRSISSTREQPAGGLFLKHDVECNIERAVEMAQIEADCGHVATFYFQADLLDTEAGKDAVRQIGKMGHEVAYHYDVLDENDGDFAKSEEQFDHYLSVFSAIGHNIRTVCPHGNPTKVRNGWRSNKDFFKNDTIRKKYPDIYDIVVDFDGRFPGGIYLSDAGYALRIIGDIGGNDASNASAMADGLPIEWSSLNSRLKENESMILSLHPHRFVASRAAALTRKVVFKVLKQAYRIAGKIPGVSKILNRYYSLARRV
ncbi:hypothetical protein [Parasphingorhabdus sp.]|uniref:hypothetical protein n=1 Tax=Parasphingorhabdus sp. TaxID=2709688 RepID=UPI0032656075